MPDHPETLADALRASRSMRDVYNQEHGAGAAEDIIRAADADADDSTEWTRDKLESMTDAEYAEHRADILASAS